MNMRDGMSLAVRTAGVQDTTCEAASRMEDADTDARNELVDFIVHRAFYPVLMADRTGPHRARIEHVQAATRAEIERFRSYGSAEEVISSFQRDLQSRPTKSINSELKLLHLPMIDDFRDDFERKARELGYEPATLLTSLSGDIDDSSQDHSCDFSVFRRNQRHEHDPG